MLSIDRGGFEAAAVEHASTIYVHGAGRQAAPQIVKRRLDCQIFGEAQGDRTFVAYYADVFYGPVREPGDDAEDDTDRWFEVEDENDWPVDVESFARWRLDRDRKPDERPLRLAGAMFERADSVSAEAALPPAAAHGDISFPELAFRIVMGIIARDVVGYLFDGYAEAVRERFRAAFRQAIDPVLVIGHSLGTIVAFDVLSEPEFADREVARLITIGSPLGIDNIQRELRDRAGEPHPIPGPVASWRNMADPRDPVASGCTLADNYLANARGCQIVDDLSLRNDGPLHHDLTAYLALEAVRRAIGVG